MSFLDSLFKGKKEKQAKEEEENQRQPTPPEPPPKPTPADADVNTEAEPVSPVSGESQEQIDQIIGELHDIEAILGGSGSQENAQSQMAADSMTSVKLPLSEIRRLAPDALSEDAPEDDDKQYDVLIKNAYEQLGAGKVTTSIRNLTADLPDQYVNPECDRDADVNLPLAAVVNGIDPQELKQRTTATERADGLDELPDPFARLDGEAPATADTPAAAADAPEQAETEPLEAEADRGDAVTDEAASGRAEPAAGEVEESSAEQAAEEVPEPATTEAEDEAAEAPGVTREVEEKVEEETEEPTVQEAEERPGLQPMGDIFSRAEEEPEEEKTPASEAEQGVDEEEVRPEEATAAEAVAEEGSPVFERADDAETEPQAEEQTTAEEEAPEAASIFERAEEAESRVDEPSQPEPAETPSIFERAGEAETETAASTESEETAETPSVFERADERDAGSGPGEPVEQEEQPAAAAFQSAAPDTGEVSGRPSDEKVSADTYAGPMPVVLVREIDINSATARELWEDLPGIGKVMAERIIQDREEKGPYLSPFDLSRVPGIGKMGFERITGLTWREEVSDQRYSLRTIFGVSASGLPDVRDIAAQIKQLDGFQGCVIAHEDGHILASSWEEKGDDAVAAFTPQIFKNIARYVNQLNMGDVNSITFFANQTPVTLVRREPVYLIAIHAENQFHKKHVRIAQRAGFELGQRFRHFGKSEDMDRHVLD